MTRIEDTFIIVAKKDHMFHKCQTESDVKALFRKLAFYLHPDHGGDKDLFILLEETKINELKRFRISSDKMNKNSTHEKKRSYKYEEAEDDIHVGDERLEIFKEIYAFADKHKSFCTSFLNSVHDYLEERGYITCNQYNALVRLYVRFRIYDA